MNRRQFLGTTAILGLPRPGGGEALTGEYGAIRTADQSDVRPVIIASTWNFKDANEKAYDSIVAGGSLLDGIEEGIKTVEADLEVTSVGAGGFPDRDGHVTLDACIMEGTGRCGSVLFLEGFKHPISLARQVMEKTPHVILAGEGAEQFAEESGLTREISMGDVAGKAYREWLESSKYKPKTIDRENHDTIGMLALRDGKMAGGCSTSGAAWKMHGRVGDSPIIGAGLFVDDEVGGATSTGLGETVISIAGTSMIVELMRQGTPPEAACRIAVERIIKKQPRYRSERGFLVGFLALRTDGEVGAFCFRAGFEYAVLKDGKKTIYKSPYLE